MRLDYVSALELNNSSFSYEGKVYPYSGVFSIRFFAKVTRRSINLVPTGESHQARLIVFMTDNTSVDIRPDTSVVGTMNDLGVKELHFASEFLSDITFNHRIRRFEDSMLTKNFFSYGCYQFHRSGDVFDRGRLCLNVRSKDLSIQLHPFALEFSVRKGFRDSIKRIFNKPNFLINIEKDRDCVLYMLKNYIGLSWASERTREKKVDRRTLFYHTVIRFGASLTSADGHTEKNELQCLRNFFGITIDEFPDAARIFNDQIRSPKSIAEIISPFTNEFTREVNIRERFLFGMIGVALADGTLHTDELRLLHEAANYLQLSDQAVVRAFEAAGVEIGGSDVGQRIQRTLRERHLHTLGVNADASDDEITAAYRGLVKRYHPDLLRAQQMPEAEIRRAEEMLAVINVAYNWLKQKAQN